VRTVLGLLAESLKRDQITVDSSGCRETAIVSIEAARLRQMLLNLLTFARLRVKKQGQIELAMIVSDARAELSISHGGPSLTAEQAARLFEPFQSPIDSGSGLEMALVQAHVLAVGGSVRYEQPHPPGNRLVLSLPVGRSVHKERHHEFQT
jgi:C4-dicarboxylate-specific signal transduction histidine kinase